VYLFIIIFIPL